MSDKNKKWIVTTNAHSWAKANTQRRAENHAIELAQIDDAAPDKDVHINIYQVKGEYEINNYNGAVKAEEFLQERHYKTTVQTLHKIREKMDEILMQKESNYEELDQ